MSVLIKITVGTKDKVISYNKKKSEAKQISIQVEDLSEEEVYEEEEEIDFCDEEQIERGRVKIYEKIVLAQRKIEEAKRALQQLTHECFVANEELEAFNTKVEQNRVRDLSEQHLVDAPNFIPLLHPKSISELFKLPT